MESTNDSLEQKDLLPLDKKQKFSGGKFSKKRKKINTIRLSKIKYQEKVLQVKRVTKVVKGGKKMTFRAVLVIGDQKKKVGVGIGRGDEVNLAISKAILNAKKNLIHIPLTIHSSIPHVIEAKFGASHIMLRPASLGTGVIAGGSVRTVLELAGLKNILGKQFGSKNILNNAEATILALTKLNEKIELGKAQSSRHQAFYNQILKHSKYAKIIF